jgi:hypothetical protein
MPGTSRAPRPSNWALAGVLAGHVVLGFVWLFVLVGVVFFTSTETSAIDLAFWIGSLCWLGGLGIIGKGWQSGSHWYWGVPLAWAVVVGTASFVVVADALRT